jgi:hypothetical protein
MLFFPKKSKIVNITRSIFNFLPFKLELVITAFGGVPVVVKVSKLV